MCLKAVVVEMGEGGRGRWRKVELYYLRILARDRGAMDLIHIHLRH
jgi:hypothetical protein